MQAKNSIKYVVSSIELGKEKIQRKLQGASKEMKYQPRNDRKKGKMDSRLLGNDIKESEKSVYSI